MDLEVEGPEGLSLGATIHGHQGAAVPMGVAPLSETVELSCTTESTVFQISEELKCVQVLGWLVVLGPTSCEQTFSQWGMNLHVRERRTTNCVYSDHARHQKVSHLGSVGKCLLLKHGDLSSFSRTTQ